LNAKALTVATTKGLRSNSLANWRPPPPTMAVPKGWKARHRSARLRPQAVP
jgi:hypothetical protein